MALAWNVSCWREAQVPEQRGYSEAGATTAVPSGAGHSRPWPNSDMARMSASPRCVS